MVGKTNVAGARLFAVIAVTYPEGSTCGITTDPSGFSDVIYAKDTSGYWLFTVPYAGNWYVASYTGDISNPDKITYKVVGITEEGQSESVTLSYYLAVLENGVLSPLTGGINGLNYQTSFSDGKIVSVRKNSDGNYFTTENAIMVTDYSTLYLRITYNSKTTFVDHYYGLTQEKIVNGPISDESRKFKYYKFVSKADIVKDSTVEITVDISSANGDYYIAACTQDAWKIDTIRLFP